MTPMASSAGWLRWTGSDPGQGATGAPARRKALPTDARRHNRTLVLQTLIEQAPLSRAELARQTGLTKPTVSALVTELLVDGLLVEGEPSGAPRPGKPATLLRLRSDHASLVALDLSDERVFRGALLDLECTVRQEVTHPVAGGTGEAALAHVDELLHQLVGLSERPVLAVGVATPGVVHHGSEVFAQAMEWRDVDLAGRLTSLVGVPVLLMNDANLAGVAEIRFGSAGGDFLLVRFGRGLGAGLVLGGQVQQGHHDRAGEIGHVGVGPGPDRRRCACGRYCLEALLSVPALEEALAAPGAARQSLLRSAGESLGGVLVPVVAATGVSEIVLDGPPELIDGPLRAGVVDVIAERTQPSVHGRVDVRLATAGASSLLRGAAALALRDQLGVH